MRTTVPRRPAVALVAALITAVVLTSAPLPTRAQASGPDLAALDDAFAQVRTVLAGAGAQGVDAGVVAAQQARLDDAQALVAMLGGAQAGGLEPAVALARAATAAQARELGVEMAPLAPGNGAPSQAVLALAAAHGIAPGPTEAARIAFLDSLPEPTRSALARLVWAFVGFESATQAAYADLPAQLSEPSGSGVRPALGGLLAARDELLGAVPALSLAVAAAPVGPDIGPIELPAGTDSGVVFIDLSEGANTYTRDFALVIDGGGSDIYNNNAGGRHRAPGATSPCPGAFVNALIADPTRLASLITTDALVDLGTGSDRYGDPSAPRDCGANGGGYLGAGVLVDGGGDDLYSAGGPGPIDASVGAGDKGGTNGGATRSGVGLVVDAGGYDRFAGGDRGANGGAYGGIGGLIHAGGGGGTYTGGSSGVNGGAALDPLGAAVGAVSKPETGADGVASHGMLIDSGGDNAYEGGAYGVNGGAWGVASGTLLDGGGNDTYSGTRIGVNGGASGVVLGPFARTTPAGLLVDGAGNDTYRATGGAANGGAYNGASGALIDGGGNDRYDGGDASVNGGAAELAVGALADADGNDCYSTSGSYATNGGSPPAGFSSGVGLLSDLGGYDTYRNPSGSANNATVAPKGGTGAQLDLGPVPASGDPCAIPTTTTTTSTTSTTSIPTTTTTTSTTTTTTIPTTTTTTPPPPPPSGDARWVHEPTGAYPPARSEGAIAAHPGSGRVVLFGGQGPLGIAADLPVLRLLDDTWTWDGSRWNRELPETKPSPRRAAAMAAHAPTGKVILFGGSTNLHQQAQTGVDFSDTWAWNGLQWENVTPELPTSPCSRQVAPKLPCISPPARLSAALAPDSTGRLVLFGGENASSGQGLSDTWTWDGVTWHQEQPAKSPPLRDGPGMAYHLGSGRVVLFGGINDSGVLGDTWTWDGSTWRQEFPAASPTPRIHPEMADHALLGRVVLFGGERLGYGALDDTWTWDGTTWASHNAVERPPPDGPGAQNGFNGMAYHSASGRVLVLVAGTASTPVAGFNVSLGSPLGDTWTWDGRTGGPLPPVEPVDARRDIKLTLSRQRIPADGISISELTATYTVGGRPSAGRGIEFYADEELPFTPESCRTGLDGTCIVEVRSITKPGDVVIYAQSQESITFDDFTITLTLDPVPCDQKRLPDRGPDDWWANLDLSFGCHGTVVSELGDRIYAKDMALQENRGIVVLTSAEWLGGLPDREYTEAYVSYLVRYKSDGSIDTDFGSGGKAKVRGAGEAVAIQPDGKIVALMRRLRPPAVKVWVLSRFNADGSPDDGSPADTTKGDSFGQGGSTVLGEGGSLELAGLAVNPDDGAIVAAGSDSGAAVVFGRRSDGRLAPDGSPDAFGDQGRVSFNWFVGEPAGAVSALAFQPGDGRIVVGGTWTRAGRKQMAVGRLRRDGSFDDTGFNPCSAAPSGPCGGKASAATEANAPFQDLKLAPDGKIVILSNAFELARFNPDGTPDPGFQTCSAAAAPPLSCREFSLARFSGASAMDLTPDGRIVVTGASTPLDEGIEDANEKNPRAQFLVARFHPDGGLDETCGYPGFTRTDFGFQSGATTALVQPYDGRVVAAGLVESGGPNFDVAMARYQGGGPSPFDRVSVADAGVVAEPASGSGSAEARFTVSLDQPSCEPITVDYATADGSATGGQDYTPAAASVTIAPGQTSATVAVAVLGDTVAEGSEQFHLDLANPRNGLDSAVTSRRPGDAVSSPITLSRPRGSATIADAGPAVTVSDLAVVEPATGAISAVFNLSLNGPAVAPVTLSYATDDVSAVAPGDYTPVSGSLTIATGQSSAEVKVAVRSDGAAEPTETFALRISADGAVVTDAEGIATIADAPAPGPIPVVGVGDVSVAEGAGTTAILNVSLDRPAPGPISVGWSTVDGSARAGTDYVGASGRIDFALGEHSKQLRVAVVGDANVEPTEEFFVDLAGPTGAHLGRSRGTAEITDDDRVVLGVGDDGVLEAEGPAVVAVTLSAPAPEAITVAYSTADRSAGAGSDYRSASATVVFAPGQTRIDVAVDVVNDATPEPTETLVVELRVPNAPPYLDIGRPQAQITVFDDDGPIPTSALSPPPPSRVAAALPLAPLVPLVLPPPPPPASLAGPSAGGFFSLPPLPLPPPPVLNQPLPLSQPSPLSQPQAQNATQAQSATQAQTATQAQVQSQTQAAAQGALVADRERQGEVEGAQISRRDHQTGTYLATSRQATVPSGAVVWIGSLMALGFGLAARGQRQTNPVRAQVQRPPRSRQRGRRRR